MPPIFGIDFGTSNSALSVCVDGGVRLLDVDPGNPISNALKSILYFLKEDGEIHTFVGHEGIKQYIDTEAEGRYMQSIKTFLPDTGFDKTIVFGHSYTLEALISIFLSTIKSRGEALIGQEVTDLVLGRPVVFSEDREREAVAVRRLMGAAELAGFKHITLQMEPIAAAMAYETTLGPAEEKIVLVGDFGAGSSDFTVHRAGGNRKRDILSTGGLYVGGDDFDARIMRDRVADHYGKTVRVTSMFSDNETGLSPLVLRRLMRWHTIPQLRRPSTLDNIKELMVSAGLRDKKRLGNLQRLIQSNYGYLLFRAIEQTKCRLSCQDDALLVFDRYGMAINDTLTRTDFQEMITAEIDAIGTCIDQTLNDAGLGTDQIDRVFLTGGSSHIPLIRALFEQRIGADKIRIGDAFTSVAYGLGIWASRLNG